MSGEGNVHGAPRNQGAHIICRESDGVVVGLRASLSVTIQMTGAGCASQQLVCPGYRLA